MAKIRRQTFTLEMYLKKMKNLDIRADQDVQRMANQWNNNMASELIISILNDEYVPPIILGMEKNSQSWIIDGLQRSSTLMLFRYGNLKISPSVEEPVIRYKAKARDENGNVLIDGCGDIVWEDREFDIRRKTFERMPEELQNKFNEFQLETVIHENYSMEQISRLVRRFNFNKGMSIAQKAFTFCDVYARRIREILKRKFFIEAPYTNAERKNGTVERILMESVMCMFHLNNWKKSSQIGQYVNEHSSMEEFNTLENCIERLENIATDDTYSLFTSRDSFLLFSLFHKFTCLNLEDDKRFADFLYAFKNGLCDKEVNGKIFYEKGRSLKDKPVIVEKLALLETLMYEFLEIPKPETGIDTESILTFVRENVNPDVTKEDIELYKDMLDDFAEEMDKNNELLNKGNQLSLIGIIAYSFEHDIDLDNWIVDFCGRNDSYIEDQTENFRFMREDLEQFVKQSAVA